MTVQTAPPRHPFWVVSLSSLLLSIITVIVVAVASWQTGAWQYNAIAIMMLAFVGVHGGAWWLVRRSRRFDRAIWLIVAAKIVLALLAPFYVTDYWLIGFMFLASIPMQIGLVDSLHRMPLFIVISLLSAAAMVVLDMVAPTDRLMILSREPQVIVIVVLLLLVSFIELSYALWRLRLRPGAPFHVRIDLATQQALIFTVISAASITIVLGVLIAQILVLQVQQVGQNFQTLAEVNSERVANTLERQIEALTSLGRRESTLIDGLEIANATYAAADSAITTLLAERERLWRTLPEASQFVLQYRSNEQSIALSRFRGNDLLHNNLFLTDRRGALVAAQGSRPDQFVYADEDWWRIAWNDGQGGTYIGRLTFDPATDATTIFIAVGVLNPQTNRTIGVLASTYQLRTIQRDMSLHDQDVSGAVYLYTRDGTIIAGPDDSRIGERADIGQPEAGWRMGSDPGGSAAIFALAPLATADRFNPAALADLGWWVMVSDTQVNALAEVTRSTKVASLVGLLVMGGLVVVASAMARFITRPINALTRTAVTISGGNLEPRADAVGPVEMVMLADAFNTLTDRLRSLINNLQDQVMQHTVQLEARVEQLAMLNRITLTVAAQPDLGTSLETVAQEMAFLLNAYISGIALLNDDCTELTIVAEYIRNDAHASAVGFVSDLRANPASARVIETGRSLIVTDPQINDLLAGQQPLMRARRVQGLMLVPLRTRGEVIGTIAVMTDQLNREFTLAEVELAETVAGQLAGVIENARLFTAMEQAKETAEAANEAKSNFLANVSHELRTPLTAVLGFAHLIDKRLEERILPLVETDDRKVNRAIEQVRANIDIIIAEGTRLTTLINDVLDLSKIEAGRVEWHMQQIHAHEIVDRALAATSSLFADKPRIRPLRDIAPGLPPVWGDHDRLVQVVINLLSNAVKFTDAGTVTCRVMQTEQALSFSVIDTGIGIAPADREQIFDKFTQVSDDTMIGKPRGTGLGLAICKEIVEYHGGYIRVESAPGPGSTFTFTVPLAAPATATPSGNGNLRQHEHDEENTDRG